MTPGERVRAWAGEAEPDAATNRNARSNGKFDVEEWIARHDLKVRRGPLPWNDGGMKWELEVCSFNPEEHTGGCACITRAADGTLGYKCHHHSCIDHGWRELRELLDGPRPPQKSAKPRAEFRLAVSGAAEIYDADFPEPDPIVKPILYPGLTLLAGRAKLGKSWMALDLALGIVQEQKFAGFLEVQKPGRVLYISLEERPRQTRGRLRKLTPRGDFLKNLKFIHDLPPLMAGGAAVLDTHLAEHPVEVVIVDSLLALSRQAGRRNVDVMQADYNIIAVLREIAERHKVALILVCHTRKAAGDYFVDLVQGTTGTTAAADAVWVLTKKSDGTGTLNVTGREVEDRLYGLKREGPLWQIVGEGEEFTQGEDRFEVIELLRENGPMKPAAIARDLQKRGPAVRKLLRRMVDGGLIVRKQYGQYQALGGGSSHEESR